MHHEVPVFRCTRCGQPCQLGERDIEILQRPKRFGARPGSGRRPANIVKNQPDRCVTILLNSAGKIVSDRRHPIGSLRGKSAPFALHDIGVPVRWMTGHREEANVWTISGLGLFSAIEHKAKRKAHVRLAAAQPHIAHHHVV
jgi:hypothetical protein